MKLKPKGLNFSACPFIHQQSGALYPSSVAGEGDVRWGVCGEHPSHGRQGGRGGRCSRLLLELLTAALHGGARRAQVGNDALHFSTVVKVSENLVLAV